MDPSLSDGLALAFLDGPWEMAPLLARGQVALGSKPRWLAGLCGRVLAHFDECPVSATLLARFIANDEPLAVALARPEPRVRIRRWFFPTPRMLPVRGPPANFQVPRIETESALASFLSVTPTQLDWFADVTRRNAAVVDQRLRHYRYRWVPKRSLGFRLLETPKPRLAAMQRLIARAVLSKLPPSAAAHGFVPARSVLSFVQPHIGQHVVLRLDLEDFFCAITLARVRAIFARVGYPEAVACRLAALCCVPTPHDVIRAQPQQGADVSERFLSGRRLRTAHLPQGAPSSPSLSNLVTFKLDRRLAGLARSAGACYTRYADDLVFSGDPLFARGLPRFIPRVAAIVHEEGFRVRFRKTRVMRAGARQQVAGLLVNQRINVSRRDYDALRALLYNAARFGPATQNRDQHELFRSHLVGRIAWVASTNPTRGARLRALFDRIDWSA